MQAFRDCDILHLPHSSLRTQDISQGHGQVVSGHGPPGHSPHIGGGVLRPTENSDKSFSSFELLHRPHLCLWAPALFSKNSIVCPQSAHLYSNIGITQSPFQGLIALMCVSIPGYQSPGQDVRQGHYTSAEARGNCSINSRSITISPARRNPCRRTRW